MRLAFLIIAVMAISCRISYSEEKLTISRVFDNICVASHLNKNLIEGMVGSVADYFGMKVSELTIDVLRQTNPDNVEGWGISGEKIAFIVTFAEKKMSYGTSRSCAVASEKSDANLLRAYIEENYQIKKIVDQRQGGSMVSVYRADLLGFEDPMYISLQEDKSVGIVFISFFENAS